MKNKSLSLLLIAGLTLGCTSQQQALTPGKAALAGAGAVAGTVYGVSACNVLHAKNLLSLKSEYQKSLFLSLFGGHNAGLICKWGEGEFYRKDDDGNLSLNMDKIFIDPFYLSDFKAKLDQYARGKRLADADKAYYLVHFKNALDAESARISSLINSLMIAETVGIGFRSSAHFWLKRLGFFLKWLSHMKKATVDQESYTKQAQLLEQKLERALVPEDNRRARYGQNTSGLNP